ncbi:MAG TPA: PilZ domain-containing protein [Candidatus Acidoferrum sp.]|nr:PilZ domain-containing protein [Candidatus Acidoferrum sp.]
MEKRLPIAMVVNLAPAVAQTVNAAEMTYTENVSAHGACVVSNHRWQPGEIAEVTSFPDRIPMRGKVAYCRRHGNDQYAVGLNFQNDAVLWSIYLKYAGHTQGVALRHRFVS